MKQHQQFQLVDRRHSYLENIVMSQIKEKKKLYWDYVCSLSIANTLRRECACIKDGKFLSFSCVGSDSEIYFLSPKINDRQRINVPKREREGEKDICGVGWGRWRQQKLIKWIIYEVPQSDTHRHRTNLINAYWFCSGHSYTI